HAARGHAGTRRKSRPAHKREQNVFAAVYFVNCGNSICAVWQLLCKNHFARLLIQDVELGVVRGEEYQASSCDDKRAPRGDVSPQFVAWSRLRKIAIGRLPHNLTRVQVISRKRAPGRSDDITLRTVTSLVPR